jgi:hypothetical protein
MICSSHVFFINNPDPNHDPKLRLKPDPDTDPDSKNNYFGSTTLVFTIIMLKRIRLCGF